jgi:hypothetical protein
MDLKEFNQKYGRQTLILSCLGIWVYILWSFSVNGYLETWYQWRIPAKMPPFIDFRLIPSGAETFRAGLDPAVSNPSDPMNHIFNYPKIWYLFFYTGITQDDTIWLSTLLIVLFFLTVFIFPEKLDSKNALLMLPVVFSPAAILLYERGNVDLAFFVLCGLSVMLVDRYPGYSSSVLLLASFFKLFPFFGVGIFLQENKNRFYRYFLFCLLIFFIYLVTNFESLSAAWSLTMRSNFMSYGDRIIFDLFHDYFLFYSLKVMTEDWAVVFLKILPHLFTFALFAVIFFFGVRSKYSIGTDSERNLAAFRMGACIYIGTFLLGNNWDYRLAFLIFCVPQLLHWLFAKEQTIRLPIWATFTTMLISCWYAFIRESFLVATDGNFEFQYNVFDETMNWMLLAGMTYLLVLSTPQWVRSLSWRPSWREIWTGK